VINCSKKEELCVINVRRDVDVMLLFARGVSVLEEIQFREVQVKYANFSTTVGGLNWHCNENTSSRFPYETQLGHSQKND
jgi:hypothetical protein